MITVTSSRTRTCLILASAAVLLGGCVRPAPQPEVATPPGVVSHGVPDIVVKAPEERLLNGQRDAIHAQWQEAEAAFLDVYGNGAARAETRAQALYELGQLYFNYLNPQRDTAKAIGWYGKLVDEFPNDLLAPDALKRIDELKRSGEPPSPIR